MTVLSVWENEPPLPSESHVLWPTPHRLLSLYAHTHTKWCLGHETDSVSLETVPRAHEEVHHSSQVLTCPPVDRGLKPSLSRSESRCLYPCFTSHPLPLHSVPPPSSLSRNKHFKHPASCCIHARSHPSGLLVIERVFRRDRGETSPHHPLFLFSFVPHKWG